MLRQLEPLDQIEANAKGGNVKENGESSGRPLRVQCIGNDIYLFEVPPTAFTAIIVGSLATEVSVEELARIINRNPDLAHFRVGVLTLRARGRCAPA